MTARPVTVRMAEAKAKMIARGRVPRVFFLGPDDYAEFCATGPAYGWVPFHQQGKPTKLLCPLFEKIAVRASAAKPVKNIGRHVSTLFCCVGVRISVAAE